MAPDVGSHPPQLRRLPTVLTEHRLEKGLMMRESQISSTISILVRHSQSRRIERKNYIIILTTK